MPRMGELAGSDNYDAVDWSRMNQPFGELSDPNPVLHSAAGGLVQIRPSDVEAATAAAMGASGGGLSTKAVPKPRLVAAPEGGVYDASQIRPNEKYFKTVDPGGGPGLEALVRFNDKTAHIQDVLVPGMPRETGRGAIGTADMRDLLRQFREMHPDITTLTGKRVSGAGEGGGYSLISEPRNVSLALPDAPPAMGKILSPQSKGNKAGTENAPATGGAPLMNAPYIKDAVRVANPGVYKRPDVIAAEAAARVEPEHPALKALFGVTRDDLYEISQQGRRQGNMQPDLWQPMRPGKAPEAATAVMNPANEQRLIDTLAEARKHEGLEKGMVPWYVMDPLYKRMEALVGPERAAKEYRDFNMSMTPFSAGSSVPSEINRGTAANMMRKRGEYDVFEKYGGLKAGARNTPDYPEILREVNGIMGHMNQAGPVRRYMETGQHGYGKDQVKINLYSGASGVPETGFQTTGAVPDAHFTRALGVPDARKIPEGFNDYMGGTEYRQIGPWYRDKIAKPLDLEAVPSQALMWGTYGPQTGVKTKIGAGKLELLSKQMWERAMRKGVDPALFRDQVLRGEQHSELEDDNQGMGSLASLSRYG